MTGVQLTILRRMCLNASLGIGTGDVRQERPIADTPLTIVSLMMTLHWETHQYDKGDDIFRWTENT